MMWLIDFFSAALFTPRDPGFRQGAKIRHIEDPYTDFAVPPFRAVIVVVAFQIFSSFAHGNRVCIIDSSFPKTLHTV